MPYTGSCGDVGMEAISCGNAFPGTATDNAYWTSSQSAAPPPNIYVVEFQAGTASFQRATDPGYARCVHSM